MANQVQNPPTAAYILSLVGAIIGLLVGLVLMIWGVMAYTAITQYLDYYGGGFYGLGYSMGLGIAYSIYIGVGIWSLITSILIIIFATKLKANPMEHTKWGILIIIFSIIGVGGLLGLIGGILAVTYKPTAKTTQYAPPPQQYYGPLPQAQAYQAPHPQNLVCAQCGNQIARNMRFCPKCGKQQ